MNECKLLEYIHLPATHTYIDGGGLLNLKYLSKLSLHFRRRHCSKSMFDELMHLMSEIQSLKHVRLSKLKMNDASLLSICDMLVRSSVEEIHVQYESKRMCTSRSQHCDRPFCDHDDFVEVNVVDTKEEIHEHLSKFEFIIGESGKERRKSKTVVDNLELLSKKGFVIRFGEMYIIGFCSYPVMYTIVRAIIFIFDYFETK